MCRCPRSRSGLQLVCEKIVRRGADRVCASAPDHEGCLQLVSACKIVQQIVDVPVPQIKERFAARAVSACKTLEQIVDVPVPQIKEGIVDWCATGARAESVESDRVCASAPDHEGCCGRSRRTTGAAKKAGLLGLAKKTRFAAEHWEGQCTRKVFTV